ncbi:MAG TPA: GNAT family N-acetyltransferase [Chitinophagaceae bacterium]|nr:GNAT family N-acetyltransferase [Chitinophagaceae bacterium]
MIRVANQGDAEGMLAIYAPYVRNTSITFETDVPTTAQFAERISNYLENYPWLVCEKDGAIAGYAYACRYRERTAYQWSAECSVYIHDDYRRSGIAQSLYAALFRILKRQGLRNVYAVINLPNSESVRFHEKCGFTWFANYENVGYKLGNWKTVGWWRMELNAYTGEPPRPVWFSELARELVESLIR